MLNFEYYYLITLSDCSRILFNIILSTCILVTSLRDYRGNGMRNQFRLWKTLGYSQSHAIISNSFIFSSRGSNSWFQENQVEI